MINLDTFQFSERIDGAEYHFKITPDNDGFVIDKNGAFKAKVINLGPGKAAMEGDLDPKSFEVVLGWIRARYDWNAA